MYQFEFQLTPEDYAKAQRSFMLKHPQFKMLIGIGSFMLVMSLVTLIVDPRLIIPNGLFLPLLGFLLLLFPLFLLPKQTATLVVKDPRIQEIITWNITERGIQRSSHSQQEHTPWNLLQSIVETKDFLLITQATNPNSYWIFPKRIFKDAQHFTEFKDYVQHHLTKA